MKLRVHDQANTFFKKRSLLGNSDYLTTFEEEKRLREAEESELRRAQ